MTAAICLRLRDEGKKALKAQLLLYPEARVPFDTPAAAENNSGLYLECECFSISFLSFASFFGRGRGRERERGGSTSFVLDLIIAFVRGISVRSRTVS